jgi:hypothetical protein
MSVQQTSAAIDTIQHARHKDANCTFATVDYHSTQRAKTNRLGLFSA